MQGKVFTPLRLVLQPSGYGAEVTKPEAILGRHSDADIRLPLPDVSRRHCRFDYDGGQWRVTDLNSLNGTFVNGERVQSVALNEGDVIAIGGFSFAVNLSKARHQDQDPLATHDNNEAVLRCIGAAMSRTSQELKPHYRQAS